jgi:putative tRNA adenosine deaminase-associated protein
MTYFAAVLTRADADWRGDETSLDDCETLNDIADMLRDVDGQVRLLPIEQDDEYAALVRLDGDEDEPRAFLSDGHAADAYPIAAVVAEDLPEIGASDSSEIDEELEDELLDGRPLPAHDSAPFGDPDLVEDLGIPATELLAICSHHGTLPVDLLVAVCEKAGCGELFENLHG